MAQIYDEAAKYHYKKYALHTVHGCASFPWLNWKTKFQFAKVNSDSAIILQE